MAGSAFYKAPQPGPAPQATPTGAGGGLPVPGAAGVARAAVDALDHDIAEQEREMRAMAAPVALPRVSPSTMPTVLTAAYFGTHQDEHADEVDTLTNKVSYFWVASPMCALTGHAAASVPAGAVDLSPKSAPDILGAVTYETALADKACTFTTQYGASTVPIRSVFWLINTTEQTIQINAFAHLTDVVNVCVAAKYPQPGDGTGPSIVPGITERDFIARALARELVQNGPLTIVGSTTLDYAGNPVASAPGNPREMTPALAVAVAQHLWTTWSLMQQPYVSADRSTLADREQQSAAYRRGGSTPTVRIVELRRAATDHVDTRTDDDRRIVNWSHRWVVSGHWRNQAYGPHRSLRRAVYVNPFVKGPGNKPLVIAPTVHVWRR